MTKKVDAIEEDVSEAEQKRAVDEARDATNNERLTAVQELAKNRREARDAEMVDAGLEVTDTSNIDDKPDEKVIHSEEENYDAKSLKVAANKEDEEEKEETRILKVNGQDIEVPLSQILDSGIRTLQKETSADQRLQEATQLLNEAKAMRDSSPSKPDVSSITEDSTPSPEDAEKLAKTLIDGDLEEVTSAVQKLLGKGRQDSHEVATQVQQMDRTEVFGFVQDALRLESAMDKFKAPPEKGGFGDLYSVPRLQARVLEVEQELFDSGDTRDYSERLADAAKKVRQERDEEFKLSGVNIASFDETKNKKLKASSTLDSSGGRETQQRDSKPLTRTDVRKKALQKMAAARGNSNLD